jgi:hypothetical protein
MFLIFYKKSSYRRARRIKLQANSEGGVFFTPARLEPNDTRSLCELTEAASGSAHDPRKLGDEALA